MSRDLQDGATRALRDSTRDDGAARFTRARVMASLHQGRVSRRTRLALLLPIAATLAAASAWGVGSESGRAVIQQVAERIGLLNGTDRLPETPPAKAPAARSVPRAPAPAPEPAEPKHEVAPAEQPEGAPAQASQRPASPSAAAIDAAEERELVLYRAAHRAHFVEK